jgi:predicted O-linked N-acetylglucosamine transferase (SPINDLY family)
MRINKRYGSGQKHDVGGCLFKLWLEQLRARFKQHPVLGKVWRRVRFTKKLQQRELWTLMLSADVVLDTFPVGMGIVALEA